MRCQHPKPEGVRVCAPCLIRREQDFVIQLVSEMEKTYAGPDVNFPERFARLALKGLREVLEARRGPGTEHDCATILLPPGDDIPDAKCTRCNVCDRGWIYDAHEREWLPL